MAKSKKPRKKYNRTANDRRLMNTKLRALPYEFGVLCQPIDSFFDGILDTGEVDEIQGRAVFNDIIFDRILDVNLSGVSFVETVELLADRKGKPSRFLKPLKAFFVDIDSGREFSAKELQSAYDGWQITKVLIGDSSIYEFVKAVKKWEMKHESQRNNCRLS